MGSFLLDDDGDLDITNNRLSLTQGAQAIQQHLKVKFKLFQGEWFLDTSIGVPYYESILVKGPNIVVVSEILKATILETPGITKLLEFNFDFNEALRNFELTFRADTDSGIVDYAQVIGA